jgi:metal-responsive CopG/Arc/MetJ family transcriptional regulator
MAASKIAITIEEKTLIRLDRLVREKKYPNRSRAIQEAVDEKIVKLERNRLRDECDKLDPDEEKSFAEEGFGSEKDSWPEY